MNSMIARKKSISLIFRGFDLAVQDVEVLVGAPASRFGNAGEFVRPNVKPRMTRSFIGFTLVFQSNYELCEMLPALFNHLGGVDHLCEIRDKVLPEHFQIEFDLPAKESEDMQDGHLPIDVIADVLKLRTTLGFSFF